MLLPAKATSQKGQPVRLLCLWGHPFEHELFSAFRPESLTVLDPEKR
jgi:hypothetical protein